MKAALKDSSIIKVLRIRPQFTIQWSPGNNPGAEAGGGKAKERQENEKEKGESQYIIMAKS